MYRSWVMETLACPRWTAPIRVESPASSMSVATVLRKLCEFGAYVNIHAVLRPMIQRGAATP